MANSSQFDYASSSALQAVSGKHIQPVRGRKYIISDLNCSMTGLFAAHFIISRCGVTFWRGYVSLKLPTFSIRKKFSKPKSAGKIFPNQQQGTRVCTMLVLIMELK
jgi:hypothetical protein